MISYLHEQYLHWHASGPAELLINSVMLLNPNQMAESGLAGNFCFRELVKNSGIPRPM